MAKHFACNVLTTLLMVVIGLSSDSAVANIVPDMPLEKKVALSDVVFIGRSISGSPAHAADKLGDLFATVEPTTILKGKPPRIVEVLVRGMIAEQNPSCCMRGRSYLFFLKRVQGAKYRSINGPFGIYPMDANYGR